MRKNHNTRRVLSAFKKSQNATNTTNATGVSCMAQLPTNSQPGALSEIRPLTSAAAGASVGLIS